MSETLQKSFLFLLIIQNSTAGFTEFSTIGKSLVADMKEWFFVNIDTMN